MLYRNVSMRRLFKVINICLTDRSSNISARVVLNLLNEFAK